MPAVRARLGIDDLGNRGGWVANSAKALAASGEVELGIVWASSLVEEYTRFEEDGTTYFCIPRGGWMERVGRRLRVLPPLRYAWQLLTYRLRQRTYGPLASCKRAVEEFKPDLLHIHGTEGFYGLLARQVDLPVLISLQGILSSVAHAYWGSIPAWRRPLFVREFLLYRQMRRNARRERQILREGSYFSGRTSWDKRQLMKANPRAIYFSDGARLLRPQFYGPTWSVERRQPASIYTTITARPYKGTIVLLEALSILRRKHPSALLRIGGYLPDSGFGRYIRTTINRLGLDHCVQLIGFVHADDIVRELLNAAAYVQASHIENSPNSVAEAQLVGTPCVATDVGGTADIVEDRVGGLLCPAGDAQAMASCIDEIFSNREFAVGLSAGGRQQALARRSESATVVRLQYIYDQMLGVPAAD